MVIKKIKEYTELISLCRSAAVSKGFKECIIRPSLIPARVLIETFTGPEKLFYFTYIEKYSSLPEYTFGIQSLDEGAVEKKDILDVMNIIFGNVPFEFEYIKEAPAEEYYLEPAFEVRSAGKLLLRGGKHPHGIGFDLNMDTFIKAKEPLI